MSTPFKRGRDFAFHVFARQYVQIALLAQQIEHLADVFVVDVDPQFAVAFALDGRLFVALTGDRRCRSIASGWCRTRQTVLQKFHHTRHRRGSGQRGSAGSCCFDLGWRRRNIMLCVSRRRLHNYWFRKFRRRRRKSHYRIHYGRDGKRDYILDFAIVFCLIFGRHSLRVR